jgi:hypothetical protein
MDLNNVHTIPAEYMERFLVGLYAPDRTGNICFTHALNNHDFDALPRLLASLHDHVNKIAKEIHSSSAYADIPHRDQLFASDSTPERPSLAYRYVVSQRNTEGVDAVTITVIMKRMDLMNMFIEAGANIHGRYDLSLHHNLLSIACLFFPDAIPVLVRLGVDANAMLGKLTPMGLAVTHDHVEAVERLLEAGVDPNDSDALMHTRLIYVAVRSGNYEIVKCLLDWFCQQIKPDFVPFDVDVRRVIADTRAFPEVEVEDPDNPPYPDQETYDETPALVLIHPELLEADKHVDRDSVPVDELLEKLDLHSCVELALEQQDIMMSWVLGWYGGVFHANDLLAKEVDQVMELGKYPPEWEGLVAMQTYMTYHKEGFGAALVAPEENFTDEELLTVFKKYWRESFPDKPLKLDDQALLQGLHKMVEEDGLQSIMPPKK